MISQKHYVFKNVLFLEISQNHWDFMHFSIAETVGIHVFPEHELGNASTHQLLTMGRMVGCIMHSGGIGFL